MTVRDLVVYGAGGHAHSVVEAIEAEGRWQLVGLLDDNAPDGAEVLGFRVLGGQQRLRQLTNDGVSAGIAAVGDNRTRLEVLARFRELGIEPVTVIHPTALVMARATIGAGSFVHGYAIVGPTCNIGEGAIISAHTTVGHQSRLGDGVHLSPGVRIGGACELGDRSTFGPGAVLYPGRWVGADAEVWANAVATRDVAPGDAVGGIPARSMRSGPTRSN